MDGLFETFGWQKEKAEKALKIAKANEAKKIIQGAKYIQVDQRTWKLTRGRS